MKGHCFGRNQLLEDHVSLIVGATDCHFVCSDVEADPQSCPGHLSPARAVCGANITIDHKVSRSLHRRTKCDSAGIPYSHGRRLKTPILVAKCQFFHLTAPTNRPPLSV